ncbi:hypothetical protein MMC25_003357 [Agyrium rufum]|nr:hypothetical protein [Agyrium rufum]
MTADQGPAHLQKTIDDIVSANGWTENIAKAILGGVENALKTGAQMGKTMQEAAEKAMAAATGFARDHPYYTALIAVGVLVILSPWTLEILGFGELGIVEESFAACWQAMYRGYVSRGSLFAFFQRLGMVWRRHLMA